MNQAETMNAYNEESYQSHSVRLEEELPSPSDIDVREILVKYTVTDENTFHHHDWTAPHWNPLTNTTTLRPEDRVEQHSYFERAIDILLQNRLPDYHTTELITVCFHAIESFGKNEHVEIANDLFRLLSWKNKTMRLLLLDMENIVQKTITSRPKSLQNGRIGITTHDGKCCVWTSNLFERSYAGGNQYNDEVYDHIISRLTFSIFHMTRHINNLSELRIILPEVCKLDIPVIFPPVIVTSLLFCVTNLNVRFAVLPSRDFILIGSSKPGSSTRILLLPLFIIFGSFVPTSSTLLLTISIA